jgi:hypothetical protein
MKTHYLNLKKAALIIGLAGAGVVSFAQQRLIGTVRTRSEYRDGVGNLAASGPNVDPAMFTSQRTNLLYGYKWTKLDFQVQVRDVRVWGQDASTINNADGNKLFLHEAWGEFTIATASDTNCWLKVDNLSLKIGRQEIAYDDVRLLGNLDWLQQGRRHDAAVLKFMHKGYQLDLGAAFNQNNDGFATRGIFYNPQNSTTNAVAYKGGYAVVNPTSINGAGPGTNAAGQMYKTMEYLYGSRKFGQTKFSVLALNDNFAKYRDSANYRIYTGDRYNNGRWTMGANFTTQVGNASGFGKIAIAGGGFVQRGNNKAGQNLEAYMANLSASYQKGNFQVGPAIDYLSGNNSNDVNNTDQKFDPLYGTPHKWWGYMDYYYVGTGGPKGGLINTQLRAKYTANRYFITVDLHNFKSDNPIAKGEYTKDLGNEIDIIFNYNVNKFVNLELGYSKYFGATEATAITKGLSGTTTKREADWAYAMFTIRPDFFFTAPVAISSSNMSNADLSSKVKELQEQIDALKQKVDPTPAEVTPEETSPSTETK